METGVERRRSERFTLRKGVDVTTLPNRRCVGQIRDISRSGLAFEYATTRDSKDESSAIDILSHDGEFRLSDIPSTTVYDVAIPNPNRSGLMQRHRHAITFAQPSAEQRDALNRLIETYR